MAVFNLINHNSSFILKIEREIYLFRELNLWLSYISYFRKIPTKYLVEMANSSTVFHDFTWPPSRNSGRCLENDAGSQLEDADTATSSTMVEMISPYSNVDPFTTPKTRTRLTSKSSGHCLECYMDLIRWIEIKLHHVKGKKNVAVVRFSIVMGRSIL